jgi:hypothetical protein
MLQNFPSSPCQLYLHTNKLILNTHTPFWPISVSNLKRPTLAIRQLYTLTRKAQYTTGYEGPKGKQRYSSTLSLTSTLDGVAGQRHDPAAVTEGKRLGTHFREGCVGHRVLLDGWRKYRTRRNSIFGLASSWTAAIPTTLSRTRLFKLQKKNYLKEPDYFSTSVIILHDLKVALMLLPPHKLRIGRIIIIIIIIMLISSLPIK